MLTVSSLSPRPELIPSRDPHFLELERDPAHHDQITLCSYREAVVGQALERRGVLHAIHRDPSGLAEFIDAEGRKWDVKGFHDEFPTNRGGFVLATALSKMDSQFRQGENVILDLAHLNPAHQAELRQAVTQNGWSNQVLFFTDAQNKREA